MSSIFTSTVLSRFARSGILIPVVASTLLAIAICLFATAPVSAQSPVDAEGRVLQFERDIKPILTRHCLECHGSRKAENDFRVDDRDTLLGYIEPSDINSSSLWTDYLITEDPEMKMPPQRENLPGLSPIELATIKLWISEGADWPETPAPAEVKTVVTSSFPARLFAFQGYFHPATVHFPIALLFFGALFSLLSFVKSDPFEAIAYYCLVFGAVSAVVASMMGWAFADTQGYPLGYTEEHEELFWHRVSGIVVAMLSTIFAAAAVAWRNSEKFGVRTFWRSGLILSAALVGLVGHQGGELVYRSLYDDAFKTLFGPQTTAVSNENAPAVTAETENLAPVDEP